MAGEGAARWVARRRALAMYAAAHEVRQLNSELAIQCG
jgi:hypothetical protein